MINQSYQKAIVSGGIIIGVVFFLIILGVINLILSGSDSGSPTPTFTPPTSTFTPSPTVSWVPSPTSTPAPTSTPTPTPQECNCTAWSIQGCGKGDCSAGARLETRSCVPVNCSVQEQCVQDSSCPFFDIPFLLNKSFSSVKSVLGDPISNQTIQIPIYNISKLNYNDAKDKYPVIVDRIISSEIPAEVAPTSEGKWNHWRNGINNIINLILKNWDDFSKAQKAYFRAQGISNSGEWGKYKEETLCCAVLPPWQCSKEGGGQICFSFPWRANYQKGTLMLDIYYSYQPENCINILVKEGRNQKCCCKVCPQGEDCFATSPDEQDWVWYFYLKDPGKTKNELLKMGNLEMGSTYYTITEDKDDDDKLLGLYIFPK